jgi:hypothetical protein
LKAQRVTLPVVERQREIVLNFLSIDFQRFIFGQGVEKSPD